jgi:uncharacterized heparinase superfamily protein
MMNEQLAWYWRRFRAMSLREAAARSHRSIIHGADASAHRMSPRRWTMTWYPPVDRLLARPPLTLPIGPLTADRAELVRELVPQAAEAVGKRAEAVCEGRFRFLGYPEVQVDFGSVDLDPFSGAVWPDRHGKRLDYRQASIGDPKWIWELNRCQDVPMLLAAWRLTNDDRFGRKAVERLEQWMRSHPPGRGIAWSNGFEAGLRAISLATALDALRGSDLLDASGAQEVLRALWQHARWIERDPSLGSSANNHRIGELVGLVVVGALARELRDADQWLETALPKLEREVSKQIQPDGTSVEQAFAYHLFVIDLLLIASAVLDSVGRPVPAGVTAALNRSGDAVWAQVDNNEPTPRYGDSDDGRALVLDGDRTRSCFGVAAGIAACLGHARAARVAGHLDATSLWLFGSDGAERFECVASADEPGSRTLPNAGITIFRGEGRRVLVDHGPLGYLTLAAHGHADALSVEVSVGRDEIVVDPGVGSYFGRPALRSAFRGTEAHATVTVDGVDSSESGGPFLWSRHAVSTVLGGGADAGFIVMEHDGYERLADPVQHRRIVVAPSDDPLVLVFDRLDARGLHRYSQCWPLHPELDIQTSEYDRVIASGPTGAVIATTASSASALRCIRGAKHPYVGWWSAGLESFQPSWLVRVDVESAGEVEIATVLVPFSTTPPYVTIALSSFDAGHRVEIDVDGERRLAVELDLGSASPWVRSQAVAEVS